MAALLRRLPRYRQGARPGAAAGGVQVLCPPLPLPLQRLGLPCRRPPHHRCPRPPLLPEAVPGQRQGGVSPPLPHLYGHIGMFDHAHKLFDEMPSLGFPRIVKSLNAVMGGAMASERFADIPLLFEQLPGELSVMLDVASYNWLVNAYCRLWCLGDALDALQKMGEADLVPKVETFNKILNGLYKKQLFWDAERVLWLRMLRGCREGILEWGRMKEGIVAPNVTSYNAKIQGLVSAGKMEEVTTVFDGL